MCDGSRRARGCASRRSFPHSHTHNKKTKAHTTHTLPSAACSATRMSAMRRAMPASSPFHSAKSAGSDSTVRATAAPCSGGDKYIRHATRRSCDATRAAVCGQLMSLNVCGWLFGGAGEMRVCVRRRARALQNKSCAPPYPQHSRRHDGERADALCFLCVSRGEGRRRKG